MKIAVFGVGYVGLVSGVGFAEMGNDVTCVGRNESKLRQLAGGTPTIYEPGLDELLGRNLREGRLAFTSEAAHSIASAEVIFIAVGTPSLPSGDADLRQVDTVAQTIGTTIAHDAVVVNKSTVPVGTAERVERIIRSAIADRRARGTLREDVAIDVVSNPEFLREGAAVKDFLNPDRVIVGVASPHARAVMERLYQPLVRAGRPLLVLERRSAELTKYASNAFLATKISFINEIAQLCEAIGADVTSVARGMGLDSRIGSRFLHAGIGWGGSCFPKDVSALRRMADAAQSPVRIVDAAHAANEDQRSHFVARLREAIGELRGATIAVWGLAFKPRTDDVRESPALTVIPKLLAAGARVRAFDPIARENAERVLGTREGLTYVTAPYDALERADALAICTEWEEFRSPDFDRMKQMLRRSIIVDGRNIYDPAELRQRGFAYSSVGRGAEVDHMPAVRGEEFLAVGTSFDR